MNKIMTLKKFVFIMGACFLTACGDDSANNGATNAKSLDADSYMSIEDFPNCTEKRNGESALDQSSGKAYVCSGKMWEEDEKSSSSNALVDSAVLVDSRDGQTYKIITIGRQTWMAENLNYETEDSYCYGNSSYYCNKYGRLYTWGTAMDSAGIWSRNGKGCGYNVKVCASTSPVRGVCPDGWHLPSQTEWDMLISTVGGLSSAYIMLASKSDWRNGGFYSEDAYSFAALPAGCMCWGHHYNSDNYNGYSEEGSYAYFWSSTEYTVYYMSDKGPLYPDSNKSNAYSVMLSARDTRWITPSMSEGHSVRCVKDESSELQSSSATWQSSSSATNISSSSVESSSSAAKISSSNAESSSSFAKSSSSVTPKSSSSKTNVSSSSFAKSSSSVTPKSSSSKTNVSSSSFAKSSSSVTPKSSSSKISVSTSTMTDTRDGQIYKTVTIGTQTWMAENLNYAYTGVPYKYKDYTSDSTSWCYDNDASNCTKYGRLYTWAAAMDSVGMWSTNGEGCGYKKKCSPTYPVRGVCPEGWHLPTKVEFETLIITVGGGQSVTVTSTAGQALKAMTGVWYPYPGTDAYEFSALPAGMRGDDGSYSQMRKWAFFWSSTEENDQYAYRMELYYNNGDEVSVGSSTKHRGFSVRCLKD